MVGPVVVVVVAVVVVDGGFGWGGVVVDAVAVGLIDEPVEDLRVGVAGERPGGDAEEDPGPQVIQGLRVGLGPGGVGDGVQPGAGGGDLVGG